MQKSCEQRCLIELQDKPDLRVLWLKQLLPNVGLSRDISKRSVESSTTAELSWMRFIIPRALKSKKCLQSQQYGGSTPFLINIFHTMLQEEQQLLLEVRTGWPAAETLNCGD
uniref:Uncharacterized protein n=1 Tax=Rhodosorus marinus TaxID=101924 RepID=A0A7S2ZD95_9RHOD|mmetsp:Transcript_14665/g.59675  ORF Transcript_14665/g.59675 Transcript_14665/m.59675 type:complete len:112 (+) Transcript_14665:451-786(+)